jgi:prephenate dehydrogenase
VRLSARPAGLLSLWPPAGAALRKPVDSPDIGIIGAGRFGAYFADQLARVGYRVQSADTRHASAGRDAARACASPLVIYAVPIRSLEQALLETRPLLSAEAVVMDVCSVKIVPCEILERVLPGRAIVGTHPLFGPQSAPDRCAGQRVAVCRLPAGAGQRGSSAPGEVAAAAAEQLFSRLGLTIVRCTPAEHDTQVARSQFLTHFIGRGAVRAGIGRVALSTKSHDDLMDIVDVVTHDSEELFEDMAALNPMVPAVRAAFLDALHAIDEQLTRRQREVRQRVEPL